MPRELVRQHIHHQVQERIGADHAALGRKRYRGYAKVALVFVAGGLAVAVADLIPGVDPGPMLASALGTLYR
jgi:hypothetical protein